MKIITKGQNKWPFFIWAKCNRCRSMQVVEYLPGDITKFAKRKLTCVVFGCELASIPNYDKDSYEIL